MNSRIPTDEAEDGAVPLIVAADDAVGSDACDVPGVVAARHQRTSCGADGRRGRAGGTRSALQYPGELLVGGVRAGRHAEQAVTDVVWRTDREHSDGGTGPRTLTEVLTYRIHTERDGRHKLHLPWEDEGDVGSWW